MALKTNTPWPLIKVCGIRDADEADIALSNGANSIGMLLVDAAKAKVSEDAARDIAAHVRKAWPDARIVMVTVQEDPQEALRQAFNTGVTAIQIHGDMSVENVAKLRALAPDLELIKVVHIMDGIAPVDTARMYAPHVDALMTDSKVAVPGGPALLGGTGMRHDAGAGRAIVAGVPGTPVILAGGLNPDNIAQAIRETGPAGIDAQSGLETNGKKDPAKIAAYAKAGQDLSLWERVG